MPKKKKTSKRKKVVRKAVKRKVIKKRLVKKKLVKKSPAKKKIIPLKKVKEKGTIIGTVTHYFPKVRAGVIKLKAALAAGDVIKIKGHTTDFTQTITSMQIDHVSVALAKKGQEIGLLVNSRVRQNDIVYKEVKK